MLLKLEKNALVALVVCAAVEHSIVDDEIVIPEENLTDESEAGFEFLTVSAEPAHEIMIQTVRHIQSESVDTKLFDPHLHTA